MAFEEFRRGRLSLGNEGHTANAVSAWEDASTLEGSYRERSSEAAYVITGPAMLFYGLGASWGNTRGVVSSGSVG